MAKIGINGLVPGKKYRMVVEADLNGEIVDAFKSIEFVVPKAPPHARNSQLKIKAMGFDGKNIINPITMVVSGSVGNKTVVVTVNSKTPHTLDTVAKVPTSIVVSGTAGSQSVVITVGSHTMAIGNKVYIYGITAAGITALNTTTQTITAITSTSITITSSITLTNGTYSTAGTLGTVVSPVKTTIFSGITNENIDGLNGKTLTVTSSTATTFTIAGVSVSLINGTYSTNLGTFSGIKTVKSPKLNLTIPENITDNLIWNNTVRDIVHILYRQAPSKNGIPTAKRKYLNDVEFSINSIPDIPSWNYGQVKTFAVKIKNTDFYAFEFVIARYVKDQNGNWTKKYWLQGKTLQAIISQTAWWGR